MRYSLLAAAFVAPALAQQSYSSSGLPASSTGPQPPGGLKPPVTTLPGEKPMISPAELVKDVKMEELVAGVQKLQDIADANGGTRGIGTSGDNATNEWIYQTLLASGAYNVYRQRLSAFVNDGNTSLIVNGKEIRSEYVNFTPSGKGSGIIKKVNNSGCDPNDYPADISGNVALVFRGRKCSGGSICCSDKSDWATTAKAVGAIAVIAVQWVPLLPGWASMAKFGDYAPVLGVSQNVGLDLLSQLDNGTLQASFVVDAVLENRTTYNVIAETKEGDHDNVLLFGSHADSSVGSPGIHDGASGAIACLVIGLSLVKYKIKNAVRIGFWGAGQSIDRGAAHYIRTINGTLSGSSQEIGKVRAYLNVDMIAAPNYFLGINDGGGTGFNVSGAPGSGKIQKDFEEFFDSRGLPHIPTEITHHRSDWDSFYEVGIPFGGLYTGGWDVKTEEQARLFGGQANILCDPYVDTKYDNVTNINRDILLLNTQGLANSVAKYALSFEGIPKSNATH